MTAGPGSRNLRHNLRLVLAEMWRWPRATASGVFILAVATAAQFHFVEHLKPTTVAVGVIGYAAAGLGAKTMLLLMFGPIIRRAPFEGSYLVATFITMVPIFIFYASALHILTAHDDNVPPLGAVALLLIAYPLFSLFFAGFLHLSEKTQLWRLRGHNKKD
jgi:hypothetical protein